MDKLFATTFLLLGMADVAPIASFVILASVVLGLLLRRFVASGISLGGLIMATLVYGIGRHQFWLHYEHRPFDDPTLTVCIAVFPFACLAAGSGALAILLGAAASAIGTIRQRIEGKRSFQHAARG